MKRTKICVVVLLLLLLYALVAGCARGLEKQDSGNNNANNDKTGQLSRSPVEKIPPRERGLADKLVIGAREEVKKQVRYDPSYQRIDYPGGDVPPEVGVCTDVVVRAYRHADIDLQQLVHEDMTANFDLYPQNWGLKGPDPNIDHRRVPNLVKFMQRHGDSLTIEVEKDNLSEWQWGDVVFWKYPNGLDHCGIVSDRKNARGIPLVIHNAGMALEEDCLTRWEITGHFRCPTLPKTTKEP